MRKTFLLILAFCLFNNMMQAQFEVNSIGYSISASEYAPSMYIYALVINNQMIDSKRMTLTN